MGKTVRKTYQSAVTKQADDRTLIVKISTSKPDRSHDVVVAKGADTKNYLRNPVVALNHNYQGLAIAKTEELKVTDDGIMAKVRFPKKGVHQLSDTVYELYKDGFMNAWSIGFIPKKFSDNEEGGKRFKEWELLEYSAVLVPDNPEALTMLRSKGYDVKKDGTVVSKTVIPHKKHPLADPDLTWDVRAETASASVEDLMIMSTWFNSDNPDIKSSYKLPHHKQSDKKTVLRAVFAAMASLLGARGGVGVPEKDRKGVYSHLAKHYKEFDREAPELKNYNEANLKRISLGKAIKKKSKAESPKYLLDTKTRKLTSGVIYSMKKLTKSLEVLLLAQPAKENEKDQTVIDLVSGLRLADKTIGIALRNYKKQVTGDLGIVPDDALPRKRADKDGDNL